MENIINEKFTYAVVGASNDEEKYGFKVLKDLSDAQYKVIPINPKEDEIYNLKAYASLSAVVDKIDVLVCVVPPKITYDIVKEAYNLGIDKIWMQPGSESDSAIEFCDKNNMQCIHHMCIMVRRIS